MRDELNMSQGSYAGAGMGAVNASFRVPRRQDGSIGSMRKLGIIAAIVAGVIVVILAASGFMSARKAGLPVVQADSRPLRVKPDKTNNAALESDEALMADAKPGTAILAPAPEVPATAALKKQALEAAQASSQNNRKSPSSRTRFGTNLRSSTNRCISEIFATLPSRMANASVRA